MNEMFGAGTDPLALDQDFSRLASNGMDLMNAVFYKPAYAKIRCPPVIDTFCRTLASPVASQYNSLSASSRISLFYSTATKYLYFDSETKGMSYLKIKENKTKLTANEELLQDVATEQEEIAFTLDPQGFSGLKNKVVAKRSCFNRYNQYIKTEISRDICAPIRQYWITNILDLIPANYKDLDQETMERIIDDILNEINNDYYLAVKKSILDYILMEDTEKQRIGILEIFDPPENYGECQYRGIVADSKWIEHVRKKKKKIKECLVNYCQGTLSIIRVWGPKERDCFFVLRNETDEQQALMEFVSEQMKRKDNIRGHISVEWIKNIAEIFKKELTKMTKQEIRRFFDATCCLMSSQLRELITKSLLIYRDFFRKYKKDVY
jgi:dynein heavy chain